MRSANAVVRIMGAIAAAGWLATIEAAGQRQAPVAPDRTTVPSLPPMAKNIFFPSDYPSDRVPVDMNIRRPRAADEFVLVGTILRGRKRSAVIEYPGTNITQRLEKGQVIGPWAVEEVRCGGVVLARAGRRAVLAVGASSSALYGNWLLSGDGFELIGVCQVGKRRFALVKLSGAEAVRQLRVNDRFGRASVAKIADDGIVLSWAGTDHPIPIGGRFISEDQGK